MRIRSHHVAVFCSFICLQWDVFFRGDFVEPSWVGGQLGILHVHVAVSSSFGLGCTHCASWRRIRRCRRCFEVLDCVATNAIASNVETDLPMATTPSSTHRVQTNLFLPHSNPRHFYCLGKTRTRFGALNVAILLPVTWTQFPTSGRYSTSIQPPALSIQHKRHSRGPLDAVPSVWAGIPVLLCI